MRGAYSSKEVLLFDLDGTLVDSCPAHARAYVATLESRYPAWTKSFNYSVYAGQPTRQAFLAMGVTDETELEEMTQAKQDHYRRALAAGEIALFPEARTLLGRLQANGRRLFLVTGASRLSVERLLKMLEIEHLFDGIITAEDTQQGKPAPDPYLSALSHFSLAAATCLAVEDAENGVRSAQQAGVETVMVHANRILPGVPTFSDLAQLASALFA